VLGLIAQSKGVAFSGTIEQSSAFGLPDASAFGSAPGGDSASSALELLTGSHTANVFVGGPTTQRVQVLDRFAERDAIRNGDSVWLYDSDKKEAVHATRAAGDAAPDSPAITPGEAADKLLAAVAPSTAVEVVDTARVAGRAAYELRLTPTDADTLVGSAVLTVDAETGLPLGASITAKGASEPAFSVQFSKISFASPDPALFDFTPPSDVTVTEHTAAKPAPDATAAPGTVPRPTVMGDGWDAVAVFPAGTAGAGSLPKQLTTAVDGGRAVATSLVSVLVTDDGRVLVGAVTTEHLVAVAAQ
jgi:outer membrane lipoprotein-sorting protein